MTQEIAGRQLTARGYQNTATTNTNALLFDKKDDFTLKMLRVIVTADDLMHVIAFDSRRCIEWEIRDLNLTALPSAVIVGVLSGGEAHIGGRSK